MKKYLLFISLLVSCCLYGQDKSNRGKEFWLGYGNNICFTVGSYDGINSQTLVLYITAEEAADVTVSVNGTSWSQTVSIPANSSNVSITLPKSGTDDCRILNEGIFDRAVHIVSTQPIVVYAHQYNTQLSGATMLLPVETYGYTYYSVNFKQPAGTGFNDKSWFYVIAGEDNTTIQITPSDTTASGVLPGQTVTVDLNKGQLYNVFGRLTMDNICDLTGSKVVSVAGADGNCHPVAMFSGSSRFVLCHGDGGEVAQQQIFPASAWGTRYLTFHSILATSNPLTTPFINFYRVIVSDPSTVVKRNGVVLTGLQRNSFYEFQSNSGDYIEADKPVIVGQYTPNNNQCTGNSVSSLGDPELMFLPSIEQGIKRTRVYNTKNANISVNYLTIIIPNNGVSSLRVNGAAIPASQRMVHPNNSNYTIVARRLIGPAAQYSIESDSAFTAMIYGAGIFESYGYIAGTLINNLNSIGDIKNIYNVTGQPNTFTCPASPFNFNIKLAYRATSLKWLFSQVTGISPATDTLINNPVPADSQMINGREYFVYGLTTQYTFSDTGTYNIPVEYSSPEIDHCSHSERSFVTVEVKEGPLANYDFNYHGCTADTAFFTALADINGYNINQYTWQFDDNTADTAMSSFKKFAEADHPVTMNAFADMGCIDDTTQIISTFPKPVAKFGYNKNICREDSLLVSDSSSVTTGNIAEWRWQFGNDHLTKNDPAPFYYNNIPRVDSNIMLTVVSDKGCMSDTIYGTAIIYDPVQPEFSINGNTCAGNAISFSPDITNGLDTVLSGSYWDFGDGQTQTVPGLIAVTHTYATPQTNIIVRYSAIQTNGCRGDTTTKLIPEIFSAPVAKFKYNALSFCPGSDIHFTNDGSSNNIQSWAWSFDGDSLNTIPPVIYQFINTGENTVTLQVTDGNGCTSQPDTQQVMIYNPPVADAGPAIIKTATQVSTINASVTGNGNYIYEWSPSLFLDNSSILKPTTNTANDILYTLKVIDTISKCAATDIVSVSVLKDLFIPSAFSPNGDSKNETWGIPAINGNPSALVTVFNRWGQIIFQSKGYTKPWDGTYKGVQQPSGAYYYIIQPDVKKEKKIAGYVMIVR